jgi:hypothetical protein
MICRITSPDSYFSALKADLSAVGTAKAAPRRQAVMEMDFMADAMGRNQTTVLKVAAKASERTTPRTNPSVRPTRATNISLWGMFANVSG